jgi:CRP/FNR family transcriptional regulator
MLATMKQTAELVDFFLTVGSKQTFKKNTVIIDRHDMPNGVYYIFEGMVKAYDVTKYHEENLLVIRKNEEIFPIIWAITGQERNIAYRAITDTTTYRVSRKSFLKFITTNESSLAPLLDMTIEMYRLHSERIFSLEYRAVRERIIAFLLNMSQRFGKQQDNGYVFIEVPLRHQDIASSVNARRETTSREIAIMARKGWLENKKSYFLLKDIKALNKNLFI